MLVAPVCKIDDSGRLNSSLRDICSRLQDVQSIAVEQEGVVSEQIAEFRNGGVAIRKSLGFELAYGSLELCGVQFHRSVLSIEIVTTQGAARCVFSLLQDGPTLVDFAHSTQMHHRDHASCVALARRPAAPRTRTTD